MPYWGLNLFSKGPNLSCFIAGFTLLAGALLAEFTTTKIKRDKIGTQQTHAILACISDDTCKIEFIECHWERSQSFHTRAKVVVRKVEDLELYQSITARENRAQIL